jgi:hypothetical protein
MTRWTHVLTVSVALLSWVDFACAQVTLFDPSVRAAGMGGASTAVLWSGDLNEGANPALLGYTRGVQYRWSDTEAPESPVPIAFHSDRFSYGWGGLGLAIESRTVQYDLTASERPIAAAISLARSLETVASLRGGSAPAFTRYVDLAAGFAYRRVHVRGWFPFSGPSADETNAMDLGLLLRGSPLPGGQGAPTLEVAYGFAASSFNEPDLRGYPITVRYRHGIAAGLGFPRSPGLIAGLERSFGRTIAAGMDPLISVSVAADIHRYQLFSDEVQDEHFGVEFSLLNTLVVRTGYVGVDGLESFSYGAGLGLPLAGFAGARYDYAHYPRGVFGSLDRHAVAVWFDPVAFVSRQR